MKAIRKIMLLCGFVATATMFTSCTSGDYLYYDVPVTYSTVIYPYHHYHPIAPPHYVPPRYTPVPRYNFGVGGGGNRGNYRNGGTPNNGGPNGNRGNGGTPNNGGSNGNRVNGGTSNSNNFRGH